METILTLVSLYYWPSFRRPSRSASSGSRKWALATAALACAIRPTSAITWGSGTWTHFSVGSFDVRLMGPCASKFSERRTEDVMNYFSVEVVNNKVESILFLMPYHATPYYSTLHRNLPMRFLDCTPSEEKGILDESDQFLMDPVGFATEYAKNWSLPSHIVLFDSQEKPLKEILVSHNFHDVNFEFFSFNNA
ncbi:Alg9-like mannosyltransferase family [Forsythia ovata]|uniref:Mannosyltransferase n=1 Tax=Forsythia ovata TaxID=205694 RepID=A0ABD1SNU5_9LAMI